MNTYYTEKTTEQCNQKLFYIYIQLIYVYILYMYMYRGSEKQLSTFLQNLSNTYTEASTYNIWHEVSQATYVVYLYPIIYR